MDNLTQVTCGLIVHTVIGKIPDPENVPVKVISSDGWIKVYVGTFEKGPFSMSDGYPILSFPHTQGRFQGVFEGKEITLPPQDETRPRDESPSQAAPGDTPNE